MSARGNTAPGKFGNPGPWVVAGTNASMAPGFETEEKLRERKAAADYWAKLSATPEKVAWGRQQLLYRRSAYTAGTSCISCLP